MIREMCLCLKHARLPFVLSFVFSTTGRYGAHHLPGWSYDGTGIRNEKQSVRIQGA
ncbi:MAG TPA: hypothetical protein PLB62_06195 [Candidatus Sumerlaeota bacterium]|nr:hypothetical protein [Candidatus Sumerlaeota bacterium]